MICSTGRRHTGHALVVAMMSSAHDLHTTACPHDRHKGAQTPGYCILICVRTLSSSLLVLASFRVQLPAGAAAGGLDNTCRAPSQGAQLPRVDHSRSSNRSISNTNDSTCAISEPKVALLPLSGRFVTAVRHGWWWRRQRGWQYATDREKMRERMRAACSERPFGEKRLLRPHAACACIRKRCCLHASH